MHCVYVHMCSASGWGTEFLCLTTLYLYEYRNTHHLINLVYGEGNICGLESGGLERLQQRMVVHFAPRLVRFGELVALHFRRELFRVRGTLHEQVLRHRQGKSPWLPASLCHGL